MARVRLVPGTTFWYQDGSWEISKLLPDKRLVTRSLTFGHDRVFDWDEFFKLCLVDGAIRLEIRRKSARVEGRSLPLEYTWADFSQVPEPGRTNAWVRYQVIKPLLELAKGLRTKAKLEERLAKSKEILPTLLPPGYQGESVFLPTRYRTLYEWINTYEASGGDIRSLVPRWDLRRKGKQSISSDFFEIVDGILKERYFVRERPSIEHVCSLIRAALHTENKLRTRYQSPPIPVPNDEDTLYMRVYRRVLSLDQQKVVASREGDRAAEEQYGGVKKGLTVERVLERVQIDHTKLDLFVVDDEDRLPIGRPTLTFCLDEKSRYPLGFYVGFEPASYLTVMHCLRHAILPKGNIKDIYPSVVHAWDAYGLPETLIVDNGKEFIGKSLEDACLQLGIELIQCPPKVPWFKAAIERRFGIINDELLHALPGTTFSNIMERGDYDSAKHAVISLSAFMEMLHVFLLDYYAERPSSNGRVPARVWEGDISEYPPALAPNRDELTVLLGKYEDRVIQRQGIEFEGLFYDSQDLRVLRARLNRGRVNERVGFKFDPADLSRIWVYDHITGSYIEAKCTDQEYAKGLSLWKHKVIRRYARETLKQVDYDSLALAKAQIQAIVDEEYTTTKQATTRQRLARFRSSGMNVRDLKQDELSVSPPVQPAADSLQDDSSQQSGASAEPESQVAEPATKQKRGSRKRADDDDKSKGAGPPAPTPPSRTSADDLDMTGWGATVIVGETQRR